MLSLSRRMPLLLMLGIALAGCYEASEHSQSPPSKASKPLASTPSKPLASTPASGEYVLTVEGMV